MNVFSHRSLEKEARVAREHDAICACTDLHLARPPSYPSFASCSMLFLRLRCFPLLPRTTRLTTFLQSKPPQTSCLRTFTMSASEHTAPLCGTQLRTDSLTDNSTECCPPQSTSNPSKPNVPHPVSFPSGYKTKGTIEGRGGFDKVYTVSYRRSYCCLAVRSTS